MNTKYSIDLNSNLNKLESYEEQDKNIAEIRIQPPGGKTMKGKGYRVELTMSLDAMLGLGTELIRKALRAKEYGLSETGGFQHLRPMDKNLVSKDLGIYLTPDSGELMIAIKDFGTVEDIIKAMKSDTNQ